MTIVDKTSAPDVEPSNGTTAEAAARPASLGEVALVARSIALLAQDPAIKTLAEIVEKIANASMVGGPPGKEGPPGPRGEPGPSGTYAISAAGTHREKLQAMFDTLVDLEIEGVKNGLSLRAARYLTEARKLIKKAIAVVAAEDETGAGAKLHAAEVRGATVSRKPTRRPMMRSRLPPDDDDDEDDDDDVTAVEPVGRGGPMGPMGMGRR